MSWLYSQALVEEYLGDTCLAGEQSAPLSGNRTQQAYCAPDRMTNFSRFSRFGMTYKPLTESRGKELLTLYLAGFHAKTYQLRGGGQESRESAAECGLTWRALLAKYDPNLHLWKTAQLSLLGDSELSSVTWPRSGMTAGGECWELPMLEPTISVTDSGSLLPTPCSIDSGSGRFNTSVGSSKQRPTLALMARKNLWPTPTAHNAKETNAPSESERNTPTLAAQVGGKLNPTWVEWLMGWPLGWTDLKPLVTDKSLFVPQQLGDY